MSIFKNLANLTKPEDFIRHYFIELKEWFSNKNLILSKEGYIGSFLHILGNLQFDVKYYYDYLFKESFPITATNNKNLIYHSNLHGYKLKLAKSATINGQFHFNFDVLPSPSLSVYKRVINLKNIVVKIGDIVYNLDSDYAVYQIRNGNGYDYLVEINRNFESYKIPISPPNMYCNIFDLNQYEIEKYTYNIPSYTRGNFSKQQVDIISDYISNIKVKIKKLDSNIFEEFDTRYSKEFTTGNDKVVFITITNNQELYIEFGNGIKGLYIPLSTAEIELYKTKGSLGNIKEGVSSIVTGDLHIYDYNINGDPIASEYVIYPIRNFMTLYIENGSGGKNPDSNDTLRSNLIEYIQSRETIISELDFNNLMNNYFDVYEILFKKTQLFDNNFYLYYPLKNKIFEPIYTSTVTYSISEFEMNAIEINEKKYVYHPEKIVNDKIFISPFLYIFNKFLNYYEG